MPEGLILEADGHDVTLENAFGLNDSCTVIAISRYGFYVPLSLPHSSAVNWFLLLKCFIIAPRLFSLQMSLMTTNYLTN